MIINAYDVMLVYPYSLHTCYHNNQDIFGLVSSDRVCVADVGAAGTETIVAYRHIHLQCFIFATKIKIVFPVVFEGMSLYRLH